MKRPPPTADGEEVPPESVCSKPCAPFEQAVVTQPTCCFFCDACRENERVVIANKLQHCERCPAEDSFTWPDEARRECVPIPPTFLRTTQVEGLALLTVDLLVFVMACTTTFLFISNGSKLADSVPPLITFFNFTHITPSHYILAREGGDGGWGWRGDGEGGGVLNCLQYNYAFKRK